MSEKKYEAGAPCTNQCAFHAGDNAVEFIQPLKAYRAWAEPDGTFTTVVFAADRNHAKRLAMRTDACEDAEYINIRVRRSPELDNCYRGRWEMNWDEPQDRIDLVKLAGFVCSYEIDDPECDICPAREWCERAEKEE